MRSKHRNYPIRSVDGFSLAEAKVVLKTAGRVGALDPVTHMPGRCSFIQLLDRLLSVEKNKVAVFMLDLDRFSMVNEMEGYEIGELLLRGVAERLMQLTPQNWVWGNLWGDKFFLAVPAVQDRAQIDAVARALLWTIHQTWRIQDREIFLTAGIGIALYPEDGKDGAQLLKNADLALFRAKANGSNTHQFYHPSFTVETAQNFQVERALRHDLARDGTGLVLYYQPRAQFQTKRITSFEALIRWKNKKLGWLLPNQFIPLAEAAGLITKVDEWVLRSACRQIRAWKDAGETVRVAVNLSAGELYKENLFDFIVYLLQENRIRPEQLEIEVTETAVMKNTERALGTLNKLKRIGVQVALDDFGTGYSSLTMLRQIPIDTLKMDRSFIGDINDSAKDRSIVQTVVTLGHLLNLKIIAEGVETQKQWDLLRDETCDEAQGFYFAKPMSAEKVIALLKKDEL